MKYKSCPPSCVLTLGKQIALVNHPFFLGFTGTTWILLTQLDYQVKNSGTKLEIEE